MAEVSVPKTDGSLGRLVIVIAGPTAVGKSNVAAVLSERLPQKCELVSADSVQVYRGLNIGSNKPSSEERDQHPIHLVDWLSPTTSCTAAMWSREAVRVIDDIHDRQRIPIVVGGSSMYVDWLVRGEPDAAASDPERRLAIAAELQTYRDALDWDAAVSLLAAHNPQRANGILRNNWRALERQLEVARTPTKRAGRTSRAAYDMRCFFLCPRDRHELFRRIDVRCLEMLRAGLLQEVADLLEQRLLVAGTPASDAIGYRQVADYLARPDFREGDTDAFMAFLQGFAAATRGYARSQVQWFMKNRDFAWLPAEVNKAEALADEIMSVLQRPAGANEDVSAQSDALRNSWSAQGFNSESYYESCWVQSELPLDYLTQLADECRRRIPASYAEACQPRAIVRVVAGNGSVPVGKVYWAGRHQVWAWGNPVGKLHKQGLQLLEERGWKAASEDDCTAAPIFCWSTRKAGDFPATATADTTLPLVRPFPVEFSDRLDDKGELAAHLKLAGHTQVHPETWSGEDFFLLDSFSQDYSHQWFLKHCRGVKGNAVHFFADTDALKRRLAQLGANGRRGFVVQRCVAPPSLRNGRKWVLRVHALLHAPPTGEPRVYCHRDMIVLEHSQAYAEDLDSRAVHISSAGNQKHCPPPSLLEDGALVTQVHSLTARTFASVWKHVPRGPFSPDGGELCQVFGFDFAFDAHGRGWVIEVNSYPAIASGTMGRVDTSVYTTLVRDVLKLVLLPSVDGDAPELGGFVRLDVPTVDGVMFPPGASNAASPCRNDSPFRYQVPSVAPQQGFGRALPDPRGQVPAWQARATLPAPWGKALPAWAAPPHLPFGSSAPESRKRSISPPRTAPTRSISPMPSRSGQALPLAAADGNHAALGASHVGLAARSAQAIPRAQNHLPKGFVPASAAAPAARRPSPVSNARQSLPARAAVAAPAPMGQAASAAPWPLARGDGHSSTPTVFQHPHQPQKRQPHMQCRNASSSPGPETQRHQRFHKQPVVVSSQPQLPSVSFTSSTTRSLSRHNSMRPGANSPERWVPSPTSTVEAPVTVAVVQSASPWCGSQRRSLIPVIASTVDTPSDGAVMRAAAPRSASKPQPCIRPLVSTPEAPPTKSAHSSTAVPVPVECGSPSVDNRTSTKKSVATCLSSAPTTPGPNCFSPRAAGGTVAMPVMEVVNENHVPEKVAYASSPDSLCTLLAEDRFVSEDAVAGDAYVNIADDTDITTGGGDELEGSPTRSRGAGRKSEVTLESDMWLCTSQSRLAAADWPAAPQETRQLCAPNICFSSLVALWKGDASQGTHADGELALVDEETHPSETQGPRDAAVVPDAPACNQFHSSGHAGQELLPSEEDVIEVRRVDQAQAANAWSEDDVDAAGVIGGWAPGVGPGAVADSNGSVEGGEVDTGDVVDAMSLTESWSAGTRSRDDVDAFRTAGSQAAAVRIEDVVDAIQAAERQAAAAQLAMEIVEAASERLAKERSQDAGASVDFGDEGSSRLGTEPETSPPPTCRWIGGRRPSHLLGRPPAPMKTQAQRSLFQASASKSFMLASLPPEALEQVIDVFQGPHHMAAGAEVVRQGDAVEHGQGALYFLEQGTLDVIKDGSKVFTYEQPGQLFGGLAVLHDMPHTATVVAASDSVVWSLDREAFLENVQAAALTTLDRYADFLSSVEVLQALHLKKLRRIAELLQPRTYEQGVEIVSCGDEALELFLVEEGSAYAVLHGRQVETYKATQHFGELALMSSQPQELSIVAEASPTKVLVLDGDSFRRILAPTVGSRMVEKALAGRVRATAAVAVAPRASSPPRRAAPAQAPILACPCVVADGAPPLVVPRLQCPAPPTEGQRNDPVAAALEEASVRAAERVRSEQPKTGIPANSWQAAPELQDRMGELTAVIRELGQRVSQLEGLSTSAYHELSQRVRDLEDDLRQSSGSQG